jgi:hypothetical protein
MPRRLQRLRIDEISSVDKGAGAGTRILLRKRDDASDIRSGTNAESGNAPNADAIDNIRDRIAGMHDPSRAFTHVVNNIARDHKITVGEAQRRVLSTPSGKAMFQLALQHDRAQNA